MTQSAPRETSSFYRRPLPETVVPFASDQGRKLFREALEAGTLEGYFALAEQFHTQSDPAFCGLGTLVIVLNALAIDPGRLWKGPWRWYGEELLDCCRPLDEVRQVGLTLGELACLAQCNGANVEVHRTEQSSKELFRSAIRSAATTAGEPHLVVAYDRSVLGQTGTGHYSPVGGFHQARDMVLVLDVARFKYPPHWVSVDKLFEAMTSTDPATGKGRGFLLFTRGRPPSALLCRLAGSDAPWRDIWEHVTRALPGRLAEARVETERDIIRIIARELRDKSSVALRVFEEPAVETLSPEYAAARRTLLEALARTELFALASAALDADVIGAVEHRPAAAAIVTLILLAAPEGCFAALPPATRARLDVLRDLGSVDVPLRAEIERIRNQVGAIEQSCSGGFR